MHPRSRTTTLHSRWVRARNPGGVILLYRAQGKGGAICAGTAARAGAHQGRGVKLVLVDVSFKQGGDRNSPVRATPSRESIYAAQARLQEATTTTVLTLVYGVTHANLAAVAPILPVSRPSFCRVLPGMRAIHPHKWRLAWLTPQSF